MCKLRDREIWILNRKKWKNNGSQGIERVAMQLGSGSRGCRKRVDNQVGKKE